jgi:competence protein ComEC
MNRERMLKPTTRFLARCLLPIFCLFSLIAILSATQLPKTLDIYVVDVEGGKSALVVSPSGEALVIDTGNIGAGAPRDAERIMAAIRDAGLHQIDHLITTHWHRDHIGAMSAIAGQFPVLEFIDHGPNVQPDVLVDEFLQHTYPKLYATSKHTVVNQGDTISLAGVDVRVVASGGQVLKTALPGAGGMNPSCAAAKRQYTDQGENPHSIGIHITFGKFRLLDLGDLTANKELELMCPNNRIGQVDVFMVSHHGQPRANSNVLLNAIKARVAIMNNGTRKGGQPEVMKRIRSAPGLQDLWQLHFSQLSGQKYTVPGLFIANLVDEPQPDMLVAMPEHGPGKVVPSPPVHNGKAFWIKVSAHQDGSFEVTNTRNGFAKTYSGGGL